jgi:hypothetical protein
MEQTPTSLPCPSSLPFSAAVQEGGCPDSPRACSSISLLAFALGLQAPFSLHDSQASLTLRLLRWRLG